MTNKIFTFIITSVILLSQFVSATPVSASSNTTLYVSVTGNDLNSGKTLDEPLATITAARNKIRTAKILNPNQSFTVVIRGGRYNLSSTFSLTERDSGTEEFPITYKSYDGETVQFVSYYDIPLTKLTEVTDSNILDKIPESAHDSVKMVSLLSCGISSYGKDWDAGSNDPKSLLLFANEELQTVARWPNNGWAYSGTIVSTNPTVMRYTYKGTEKWINSSTARMYGGFQYLWAFETRKITAVDTTAKTVTFSDGDYKASESGKPYFVYNLLEELDAPGEYFIDRSNGVLYYYPIDGLKSLALTNLTEPLLDASGVSYVTIEGIDFAMSGGIGYKFATCSNISVNNCNVYKLGSRAGNITGATNFKINGGEVYNTGSGILMRGGNRSELTGCNSGIYGMNIHNVDTYGVSATCISVTGVGITIENNELHDIRHQAFSWTGNDIVFRGNEMYRVCTMSNDSGGCYTGRNLTTRGNIFENNYFHDIFGYNNSGAHCIYFDDNLSEHIVRNNIFYNTGTPVFIHGGSDHIIENNLFIKCGAPIGIPNYSGAGKADSIAFLDTHINEVAKDANGEWRAAWKAKYPEFIARYDAQKGVVDSSGYYEIGKADGNIIRNNIFTNTSDLSYGTFAAATTQEIGNKVRNLVMYIK